MALLHFAFGGLHRQGDFPAQIASTCEHILGPRRLRAGLCPEFLPIRTEPGARWAVPASLRIEDAGVTFDEWVDAPPVALLPCDAWMVSFADLPLRKLRNWSPARHYGRLAIVFTDAFRKRGGARQVHYYSLRDLLQDPLVRRYHAAIAAQEPLDALVQELLGYRKPARLWPAFRRLFGMTELIATPAGTRTRLLTYDRYPDGYDFTEECEARVVLSEQECDLPFESADVLRVLAPDESSREKLGVYLTAHWPRVPPVGVFPGA